MIDIEPVLRLKDLLKCTLSAYLAFDFKHHLNLPLSNGFIFYNLLGCEGLGNVNKSYQSSFEQMSYTLNMFKIITTFVYLWGTFVYLEVILFYFFI